MGFVVRISAIGLNEAYSPQTGNSWLLGALLTQRKKLLGIIEVQKVLLHILVVSDGTMRVLLWLKI